MMFRFTDYISPTWFFIAFAITMLIVMILAPKKKIVVQHVDLKNHNDLVFKKAGSDDSCYKYVKEETACLN